MRGIPLQAEISRKIMALYQAKTMRYAPHSHRHAGAPQPFMLLSVYTVEVECNVAGWPGL